MNQVLFRAAQSGQIAGAYLLEGSRGAVEHEVELFVQTVMCTQHTACGVCPECKKILAGSHPDVHRIVRQSKRQSIVVEDVQDIPRLASERAFEGGYTFFIIQEADKMNEAAQNKLLKVIEEPPERTVFVLGTPQTKNILPTIVSRCIIIKIAALGYGQTAETLRRQCGAGTTAADVLARSAQGDAFLAQDMLENGYLTVRGDMLVVLRRLFGAKNKATSAVMERFSRHETMLDWVFYALETLMCDLLMLKAGQDTQKIMNTDVQAELQEIAALSGTGEVAEVLNIVQKTDMRRKTCAGIAKKLMLEAMVFEILEETV